MARFGPGGDLDGGFASAGKFLAVLGISGSGVAALGQQSSGRILLAGRAVNLAGDAVVAVTGLTPGGLTDLGYGAGGARLVKVGNGPFGAEVNDAAVLPDDRIVVAGSSVGVPALVRLDAAGAPDAGFGTAGIAFPSIPGASGINELQPLADGRLLIAGGGVGPGGDDTLYLARLLANGSLDTTFGSGGVAWRRGIPGRGVGVRGLAALPDGRAVTSAESDGFLTLDAWLGEGPGRRRPVRPAG